MVPTPDRTRPRPRPDSARDWLNTHYTDVESETGVVPGTDFIFSDLQQTLQPAVTTAAAAAPAFSGVEPAPLAVQGAPPVSGLFSFDKYSSLPLLVDDVRRDVRAAGGSDAARKLFVVPRAHVLALHAEGGTVRTIEVDVDGIRRLFDLAPGGQVVLAASTIETTRIALQSFPTPLMGRNLMAHVRSDFAIRIARSTLSVPIGPVQTAAMLVRGHTAAGRFHLQVTASTSRFGSDDLLFRMIPDMDELAVHTGAVDPNWIPVTLLGIGEMLGDRTTPVPDTSRSWIDLSPFERDEYAMPRAYVHLVARPEDLALWSAMDNAAIKLAQAVAGAPNNIQYLWDGQWRGPAVPARSTVSRVAPWARHDLPRSRHPLDG